MSNEELVAVIQAGATERMGELWEQVRRFVAQQARRVPLEGRADVELDDLIQSGYLALADAVTDYRPGEYSFLTYLKYHLKTQFAVATRFRSERQKRETLAGTLSLDAPVSQDGDSATLMFFQEDTAGVGALEDAEQQIYQAQLRETMAEVLADLPEEQRELLRLRYWDGMTLEEIGQLYGVAIESARQREKKILRELRKSRNTCRLRPFVDFDFYHGGGLGTFRTTGASVQELYLMKQDRIRERQAKQHRAALNAEMDRMEEEARQRVAMMTEEEKRALLEKYGYA